MYTELPPYVSCSEEKKFSEWYAIDKLRLLLQAKNLNHIRCLERLSQPSETVHRYSDPVESLVHYFLLHVKSLNVDGLHLVLHITCIHRWEIYTYTVTLHTHILYVQTYIHKHTHIYTYKTATSSYTIHIHPAILSGIYVVSHTWNFWTFSIILFFSCHCTLK